VSVPCFCRVNDSVETVGDISYFELGVVDFFVDVFTSLGKNIEQFEMGWHVWHFKILEEIVLDGDSDDLFAPKHDLGDNNDTKDQPLLMEGRMLPLMMGKTS